MKVNFHAPIARFAKLLNLRQEEVVQKIAMDLWGAITKRTPVDTGRARSSWTLSEGKASTHVQPEGIYGPPPTPAVPTGKTAVFIVSNIPYIKPLEYGHSKKAPAGMVRVSIAEAAARITIWVKKMDSAA